MTKTELMSASREIQLVRQLPSKRALDELVLANTGLIHKIVHRFPLKNASCGYDDLFQAGIEGLIHGIHKFDVTRGYRLSTYCYRWIQAYVSRYFQNQGKTIRVPVHMANVELQARKVTEQLTRELGRVPTSSEVEEVYPQAAQVASLQPCASLNKLMSEGDELEALCGEDKSETHDYEMECDILLSKLRTEVSERDFNIFVHRYGLLGVKEHTLSEISDFHGVTRARCHQVSNNCFRMMKSYV